MGWLARVLDISLPIANKFYTWGWRGSLIGAALTAISVGFLYWGTRIRDRDFESSVATLHTKAATFENEAADTRERAAKLEERAAELEKGNITLQRDLERERTDRLQLEERVKPRNIPADKRGTLIALLRASPKGKIAVARKTWDEEADQYAQQINQALKEAGFDPPDKPLGGILSFGVAGSFILIRDVANPPLHTAPVQRAFQAIGILLLAHADANVPDAETVWIGISSKP